MGDYKLKITHLSLKSPVTPCHVCSVALAAALAAFVAFGVVQSQAEATRTQSWDACLAAMSAGDSDSFNEVIRRYPGTDAARCAWTCLRTPGPPLCSAKRSQLGLPRGPGLSRRARI